MSLNPPSSPPLSSAPSPSRAGTVSAAVFVVGLLVAAGVAIAATSVYYDLRPASTGLSSSTPGTLTVTDDLGRTVTVPYDPARVVVLGPSIMDIMVRLGLRSHVVGVDCSVPAYGGLAGDYTPGQIANWTLTSSMCVQLYPLSDENLTALLPTLVLAATIVSIANVETISQVNGIPVVMLQPPTLSGIEVDDSLIGEIFGVQTAATALNAGLATELARAAALQANLTDNGTAFPTVLVTYDVDSDGYWTYGPGTFGESLIELASGTSIAASSTFQYPELSPEQVLVADPQVIIYGTGFDLNLSVYASQGIFWSSFSAVEDGHAFGVNAIYLTEPDPTMILIGLPLLLSLLHPDPG